MNCILYLRKSREEIEREKETGEDILSAHRDRMTKLLTSRGDEWQEFCELVSGDTIINRPVFSHVLDNVIPLGEHQAIAVNEISRLGRGDMGDADRIMKTLLRYNIIIITPNKVYNLKNPADARYIRFELFLAREEFEIIKERMSNGRDYRAREGYAPGFLATLGIESIRGKIIILPDEANLVREIFQMRLRDMSYQEIADVLNRRGLLTKRGTQYHQTTIGKILRNRRYIGQNKWRGQYYDAKMEPIIDMETWLAVQRVNGDRRGSHPVREAYYSNTYCRECGSKMYGEYHCNVNKKINKKYAPTYYYICTGRREHICNGRAFLNKVHQNIYNELVKVFNDEDILNTLIAQREKSACVSVQSVTAHIKALTKQKKEYESTLTRFDDDYTTGKLPAERYNILYDKVRSQVLALESEIVAAKGRLDNAVAIENSDDVVAAVREILRAWDLLEPAERKKVVAMVFKRIEIARDGSIFASPILPSKITNG